MADEIREIKAEDVNSTNENLERISAFMFPDNMRLKVVSLDAIKEQEVNPRSMPQKMMDQLIDNVKNAGVLESVPLCAEHQDGSISIISWHHRTRAARAAGIKYILVLTYINLEDARVKSKQLAHNTISGQDDPELVKRIYEQIGNIQAQFEAFIDPRVLNAIPEPVHFKPVDVFMQDAAKTALIVFLDTQFKDFDSAVSAIIPNADFDKIYLADKASYDGWKEALTKVREDCDIVSVPTAIAYMAQLAIERLNQLAEA